MERREETPSSGRERRVIAATDLRLERRADGDGDGDAAGQPPRIVGHAAVFDQWTTLYQSRTYLWREIIRPGAFRNAIAEGQDVRALFNHDSNYVLGRTTSGTLRLAEDAIGLVMDTDPPDTRTIRDLVLTPIERKDITQQSFAFTVRKGGERIVIRVEDDLVIEERELLDLDLYDVSPVTYPAYEGTDVALRALGAQREQEIRGKRRTGRLARMRMRLRLAEARV